MNVTAGHGTSRERVAESGYDVAMAESVTSDAHADAAYRFLRGHSRADIRFDEHLRPLKYVIAPEDGRLILSVMVAMIDALDTVLFVPETEEGAMELMVTLDQFKERGPHASAVDRWVIHHGDPPDVRWAFASIDAARYDGMVVDGEALMRPNALIRDEPALCRWLNQTHLDGVGRLCLRHAEKKLETPVVVGIDPGGIDVRGRFDVHRIEAVEPMPTAEDARRVVGAMLESVAEV